MKPCQRSSLTLQSLDERRIKCCRFLLSTRPMSAPSLPATLCPTKAFSELVESVLAFVEALGHNVVMLHSDQEPVLVQLLKAVQSRRVKRTLVRHGPRASHQSQGKIENANRVINGVCRAMWLSLARKAGKRRCPGSLPDSSRSVELDEVPSQKRRQNCICACLWEGLRAKCCQF